MNKMVVLRSLVLLSFFLSSQFLFAQETVPVSNRVDQIIDKVIERLDSESDNIFERGDFPKTIQIVRIRMELYPSDEETTTNLIFLLRSVLDESGALALAKRYKDENPQNPDRALAEAQLYWQWRQYSRIPKVLLPDINRIPAPHQNTFRMLGHAYGRMGFESEALKVWEMALKAYPGDELFEQLREKSKKKLGA